MRCVRHHRRIPHEKGLLLLSRISDKIIDRLQALATNRQSLIPVSIALRHAMSEAAVLEVTLPPLASLKTHITCTRKQSWQRGYLIQHGHPLCI